MCVCVSVCECECKLLPCLSSQPQLRARLKHRLKANQVTADGVRTGAVHSLVCVCEEERNCSNHPPNPLYVGVYAGVLPKTKPATWQVSHDVTHRLQRRRMRGATEVYVCLVYFYLFLCWKRHAYVPALPMRPRLSAANEFVVRGSQATQIFCGSGWVIKGQFCRITPPRWHIKASYDCLTLS